LSLLNLYYQVLCQPRTLPSQVLGCLGWCYLGGDAWHLLLLCLSKPGASPHPGHACGAACNTRQHDSNDVLRQSVCRPDSATLSSLQCRTASLLQLCHRCQNCYFTDVWRPLAQPLSLKPAVPCSRNTAAKSTCHAFEKQPACYNLIGNDSSIYSPDLIQ
jgi:hypothetical protein